MKTSRRTGSRATSHRVVVAALVTGSVAAMCSVAAVQAQGFGDRRDFGERREGGRFELEQRRFDEELRRIDLEQQRLAQEQQRLAVLQQNLAEQRRNLALRRAERFERGRDMRRDGARGERGAGPERSFYQGDRLPPQYNNTNFLVNNWREHRLPPPPPGTYWIQIGHDYVLVSGATGIIMQVVLN